MASMAVGTDTVKIELTREQAEELSRILTYTRDEGPDDEGWQSAEMIELRDIVDAAIRESK